MAKTLVVVESPKKIPKISKVLGSNYLVIATVGHFRDLPENELGVDLPTFTPHYQTLADKTGVAGKLRDAARAVDAVLLATDADREGEAIAWHVAQHLGLPSPKRFRSKEITEKGIRAALANVGPLDVNLVNAQQARRVLDRLVGWQVSPLLSVFGRGPSAGRVQSATLHLVAEREKARESFQSQAYWSVAVTYGEGFSVKAAARSGESAWSATRFTTEADALAVLAEARGSPHRVEALETKVAERKPPAPFKTSTLQQAAGSQLRFSAAETMALAQSLFEKGVISYHRTDSLTLSDEAIEIARTFLAQDFPRGLPEVPPQHRNSKTAQEAHEAIRPTSLTHTGIDFTTDEERLYGLITRRFLASQCRPALIEVTSLRTAAGTARFVAKGFVVRFEGFLKYCSEDETTAAAKHEGRAEEETPLPTLSVNQTLSSTDARVKAEKTKPPARFTEQTLIEEMERRGIGRPATYAATTSLLFEREYLVKEKTGLVPTPRGRLIDAAVAAAFPEVVAVATTAQMETQLDEVAAGKVEWRSLLKAWYSEFSKRLQSAPAVIQQVLRDNATLVDSVGGCQKPTGKKCPKCERELLLRDGAHGPYLSCSGWPTCGYRADPSARPSSLKCPDCNSPMIEADGKFGRYARCLREGCSGRADLTITTQEKCPRCESALKDKGAFLGCSQYPRCSFTAKAKDLARARKAGKSCPKCGKLMVARKGAKGAFLGCAGYPECRHAAPCSEAGK